MEAIILCGGLGTRLRSVVSEVPKSMAPINGKPFMQYQLDKLADAGVDSVVFAVGYKKEIIKDYFGDEYRGMSLKYSEEDEPLLTGGAIKQALKLINSNCAIVMNGDNYVDIDYNEMYEQHIATSVVATVAVKPMENFDRYGNVIVENGLIQKFIEKEPTEKGLINIGFYVLNKNVFDNMGFGDKFSVEKEFFTAYAGKLPMGAYIYDGYFIDIGLPDDYFAFQNYIKNDVE